MDLGKKDIVAKSQLMWYGKFMTVLVALSTKDALVMGCDSLGSTTKPLVDPFDLVAEYFETDDEWKLKTDKDGKPIHLLPGYVPKEQFGPLLDYMKDELYKKKVNFRDYLKSVS